VKGTPVDWPTILDHPQAQPPDLPTYAFQRKHYWLRAERAVRDLTSAGLHSSDHPLLFARLGMADSDSCVFTGRLALSSLPWLADHALRGTPLLAGTAFVEMALHAGQAIGCARLQELTLEAPLALTGSTPLDLQLVVGEPDDAGRRAVSIYSRACAHDGLETAAPWARHATGLLGPRAAAAGGRHEADESWPPPGSELLALDAYYRDLASCGYDYGEAFRAVVAAWRCGERVLAEVNLNEELGGRAHRYQIHPALLDAAFHPMLSSLTREGSDARVTRLPFTFRGVEVHRRGAIAVRATLTLQGGSTMSLLATDGDGSPVATVEAVTMRAISEEQIASIQAETADDLYVVSWESIDSARAPGLPRADALIGDPGCPLVRQMATHGSNPPTYVDVATLGDAVGRGVTPPEWAFAEVAPEEESDDLGKLVKGVLARGLAIAQAWLADDRLAGARLVMVTRGGVTTGPRERVLDLAAAALRGLMRSVQAEHPDRLTLLDIEDVDVSGRMLGASLPLDEPQLAMRRDGLFVPRLARAPRGSADSTSALRPEGTVMITGGTGAIGELVAKHLITAHGVRHLLLVSRSGSKAEGAQRLLEELSELGGEARVEACDVADASQVAALLATISEDHPLSAVIHAAGTFDYGLTEALTPDLLALALAPKVDGAINLHELTKGYDLDAFVLFSSAAGVFGGPGQGNYAAANAFLDAFAEYRRDLGLPGTALAWGAWGDVHTGRKLTDTDVRRVLGSSAAVRLSSTESLELLDRALRIREALIVPVRFDGAILRDEARAGSLPRLLAGLVPEYSAARSVQLSLAQRFGELDETGREEALVGLVQAEAAAVLGHDSSTLDPSAPLRGLGLESLSAVDLRNRLSVATGLSLPATIVFDHPTVSELASHLHRSMGAERRVARSRDQTPSARGLVSGGVAVVGIGCRFPGGVRSAEGLWDLVVAGGDGVGGFPAGRGWDLGGLYDPDPDRVGKCYVREGGFVYDADEFDAGFFGIGPGEAVAMDPQQRLLLEVCWEALEDAGIDPLGLRGSATGVFAGVMHHDYALGVRGAQESEKYLGAGSAGSVVSGRVAYSFGLEGPAVTVDTACSSSLVALHLACQALRAGECSLALAGGVTVLATPRVFIDFSRQRALAPDGRCKAFADAADGVGVGEGVGVLVLERLSDALRLGHPVLGVIRGSAINQDGASNGLTAPSGPAQQRVITQALASAGLSAADVDALEAHGTGTMLGDPIEAQALLATYGQTRHAEEPLWLGSVKSNIGHAQAAAGVAGVIKMLMAMRHGVLPRTLHVDRPSRNVDWSSGNVSLLTENIPWPDHQQPRRAGISSFGASGTNAHVIVEHGPVDAVPRDAGIVGREALSTAALPLVISAREPDALRAQAQRFGEAFDADPATALIDVAAALAQRSSLGQRAAIVTGDRGQLLCELDALSKADVGRATVRASAQRGDAVFVFPGQGAQWLGMSSALLGACEVFAEKIERCEEILAAQVEWSLTDVLTQAHDAPSLDRVDVVQPALFAVMVSLADLWMECGIRPRATVGHSQGEIAAACVAGGLSLADALRVVVQRSRALVRLAGSGGMATIAMSTAELEPLLDRWRGGLGIAAVNGPRTTVVSGGQRALEQLIAECAEHGIKARAIPVDYPAHSRSIEKVEQVLLTGCADIEGHRCEVPLYSSVTGGKLELDGLGAAHWYRNLRETVQFSRALRALLDDLGCALVIEVSPHPVLLPAIEEVIEDWIDEDGGAPVRTAPAVIGSLVRGEGGVERFLHSLAEAWVHGGEVDWRKVYASSKAPAPSLPTYAFQRRRFWIETGRGDREPSRRALDGHPFIEAPMSLADDRGWLFTGGVSLEVHPWLGDHKIDGRAIFPGAGYLELALHAARVTGSTMVKELAIEAPLLLPRAERVELQVIVGPVDDLELRPLDIYARQLTDGSANGAGWTRHARGALATRAESQAQAEPMRTSWPPQGAEQLRIDGLYRDLRLRQLEHGTAFRNLRAAWRRENDHWAEVAIAASAAEDARSCCVHPALLDAIFHVMPDGGAGSASTDTSVPFVFENVRLEEAGATSLRARLSVAPDGAVSLCACAEDGAPVLSIGSVSFRTLSEQRVREYPIDPAEPAADTALLSMSWEPVASCPRVDGEIAGCCAVIGEGAAEFEEALRQGDWDVVSAPGLQELSALCEEGGRAPATVVVSSEAVEPLLEDVRFVVGRSAHRVLDLVQQWLADARFAASRLVVVTENSISVDGERPDGLAAAPIWGLLRSAEAENPGRFTVIDNDGAPASSKALAEVLSEPGPQLAIRNGIVLAPRLMTLRGRAHAPGEAPRFGEGRTVLITGGTGGLGALLARHLISQHGVRSLVLASRRGAEAPGALDLQAELNASGARVVLAACDVSDREEIERLLATVPATEPLGAVVHAAGVLDDGVISNLTPDRVDRVMAPKLYGAWHLHELTSSLELSHFILFSSIAGTIGSAGQGCYAASNAFLDALAAFRRAQGLAGISMAWGPWAAKSGMTAHLGSLDLERFGRMGLGVLSSSQGLELFDAACATDRPLIAPVRTSVTRSGTSLVDRLMPSARQESQRRTGRPLTERLDEMSAGSRRTALLELVRGEVATVLGAAAQQQIRAGTPFQDLGFDSLKALELRNRLSAAIERRLPATLIFDHPTPADLATFLERQLVPGNAGAPRPPDIELHEILAAIPASRLRELGVLELLRGLADDSSLSERTPAAIEELDAEGLVRRALERVARKAP
jgi:acyl transferase domain-containing protein/acyl carrier protein